MKITYFIFAILVLFSAIAVAEGDEVSSSTGSSSVWSVKQGVNLAVVLIALYIGTWTYVPTRSESLYQVDGPMAILYAVIKAAAVGFTLYWTDVNLMFIITWINLELFFAVTRVTVLTRYMPSWYAPYRHFSAKGWYAIVTEDYVIPGSPLRNIHAAHVGARQSEIHNPYFVSDHLASWVFFSLAFHVLAMIGLDYLDRSKTDFVVTFSTFFYSLREEGQSNWDMQEVKNTFKTSAFLTICFGVVMGMLVKLFVSGEFTKRQ